MAQYPRDRVAAVIRARIADGTYPAGELMPKYDAIAAELGVSRGTVANAMRKLAAEDPPLVRILTGYGTFSLGPPQ